ncbi:unnamed protein product [Lymnaea stagnalis]|uniref:Uncharacterized protein n=1 Tax=Lymnaea stagnalis TaxID=6523 RepID=A0AAV2HJS5_LYMST
MIQVDTGTTETRPDKVETMFLLYRSKHVALIVQMITLAHAHLCIEDPPQRLATGNRTTVDCFQNSNPPCGKDFPQNASTNPKAIKPGSLYGVHLHMPTRHYDPEKPGSYVVSIQKVGDPEFKTLGQWRDGTEEFKILTVKLPDV